MKILVRHRDSGSQKLMDRLAASVPEFKFVQWAADGPMPPLEGIDAAIAVGPVGRDVMERGRFRLIQTVGTGYDNADVAAATELGIQVANMPASQTGNAESVAEHVILLMLALSRQLGTAQANLKIGRWAQPLGTALLEKMACIVGLGAVGTALAARLRAFGMRLTATRRDVSKGGLDAVRVLLPRLSRKRSPTPIM